MDPLAWAPRSQGYRFAIVTPSYYVDFEHCRWLCETVDRFVPPEVCHYLVVDRADRELFAPLASSRRRIVLKEEVLRGGLRQVPFSRRWWITSSGRPVRGWMVQQITKLFVSEVVDEDVLIFVDSGAFFVRPYDPGESIRDGLVPLFRENGDFFRGDPSVRWHRIGAGLLGIKPVPGANAGYVKTLVTWRRDNLVRLQGHLERVAGRSPLDSLVRLRTMSEYYVYGMYCELVLGDRAGHYTRNVTETLSHWTEETLGPRELRKLRDNLAPEHVLVMINEKSRTPLSAVRDAFRD
jgi:hypothetical protein